MKNTFTKHLYAALLGVVVLSSCSRPVAYFQRGPVEHYKTASTETVAVAATPTEVTADVTAAPAEVATITPEVAVVPAAPVAQVAQAKSAMTQIEAYVRNDSKLAADKKLNKRMDKVSAMLATTVSNEILTPAAVKAPRAMNMVERLMLKKVNKRIDAKLAPKNPERAMVNKGLLTGGIVLLLAGLLLVLLTTGTGATVGVVALLIGAIAFVLGILAS